MVAYPEEVLRRSRPLGIRVPPDLYAQMKQEAAALGVSVSDVARMKLKTGRVPTLKRAAKGGAAHELAN
jgi:hypothetical protein